jgi:hypothetical protein
MRLRFIFMILILGCNIFPKREILLVEHKQISGDEIRIYQISMGATTNDVIQVRNNQNKVLWASENYNCLKNSILISDSVLLLTLTDTGYNNYDNKIDSIRVKIK